MAIPNALAPGDASRRDVLLGGLMATVTARLPAVAFAQTTRKRSFSSTRAQELRQ